MSGNTNHISLCWRCIGCKGYFWIAVIVVQQSRLIDSIESNGDFDLMQSSLAGNEAGKRLGGSGVVTPENVFTMTTVPWTGPFQAFWDKNLIIIALPSGHMMHNFCNPSGRDPESIYQVLCHQRVSWDMIFQSASWITKQSQWSEYFMWVGSFGVAAVIIRSFFTLQKEGDKRLNS